MNDLASLNRGDQSKSMFTFTCYVGVYVCECEFMLAGWLASLH